MTPAIFSNPTLSNLIHDEKNSHVWQSERWIKRQQRFLEAARIGIFERESSILDLFPSMSESVIFIDYGGGSGWLYHKLIASKIQIKLYKNVESIDLHESCVHQGDSYRYIPLTEVFSKTNHEAGLVLLYLNSVVQYLESDSVLTNLITDCSPSYVLLEDVTISHDVEFFARQVYYETRIPYRFLSLDGLVLKMEAIGYELDRQIPYNRHAADGYTYSFTEPSDEFRIGDTVSLQFNRNQFF